MANLDLSGGPGPLRRYYLDVGVPGGANVPVDVPVQAIASDFADALTPRVNQALQAATYSIGKSVEESVAKPIQDALAKGQLVVHQEASQVSMTGFVVVGLIAAAVGYAIGRRRK